MLVLSLMNLISLDATVEHEKYLSFVHAGVLNIVKNVESLN